MSRQCMAGKIGMALQHTVTYCDSQNTLGGENVHTATRCNSLQHVAIRCNTLQHVATRYNTLQLTATHCNTPPGALVHEQEVLHSLVAGLISCKTRMALALEGAPRTRALRLPAHIPVGADKMDAGDSDDDVAWVSRYPILFVQDGEDAWDALNCRSLRAKEPLMTGLF